MIGFLIPLITIDTKFDSYKYSTKNEISFLQQSDAINNVGDNTRDSEYDPIDERITRATRVQKALNEYVTINNSCLIELIKKFDIDSFDLKRL